MVSRTYSNEEICIQENLLNFNMKSKSLWHLSQDLLPFPASSMLQKTLPWALYSGPKKREAPPSPAHSAGLLVHLGEAGCLRGFYPPPLCHRVSILYFSQ